MEEIHSFFEENTGKNFLRFESSNFQHDYRVRYYHFFQDIVGRGNKLTRVANKLFVKLQQVLGVYRHKDIEFQKGSNWFSINAELTRYVIENEYKIKEIFSNTFCCDEVYMQTLVHNTHFKNSLYHQDYDNELKSIMRYIDWERGQPYIFREIDFFDLLDSPYLFARKFNSEVDESVINKVARHIFS